MKYAGSSGTASSTYLRLQREDKSMNLGWSVIAPWTNDTFFVYRENPLNVYNLVGKTFGQTTYTDTGLSNGDQYCYYIKSSNHYDNTSILHPLYDSSETICGTPEDTIAPCSPPLTVHAECNLYIDSIVWSNPDRLCPKANKVVSYEIFYSPTENGDMAPIETITNLADTFYVTGILTSVAGCYAVIAFDSAGQNSPFNTVCVDNCPLYSLPNVFTPNGDGINDLFTPLEPYRYVKDIDINIYNRWGQLLFHTTDPNINWNGKVNNSGGECPDGVYYYVCTVNEERLAGIVPVVLKGFIEIIREK
jgi:gliding motility-associated-like protein